MANILRVEPAHNDIQGILGTALVGVTQYNPAQYRTTGIVMNNVASGDVFSMIFQMPHTKKLGSAIDSVHIHYIPNGSTNGNIAFSYTWGWYNIGDTIPATLPNSGTTSDIALQTTDQYKMKISPIISNLTAPTGEGYSSILLVKITAVAPGAGTNWWTGNTIALCYLDAHCIIDRVGSINEYTD